MIDFIVKFCLKQYCLLHSTVTKQTYSRLIDIKQIIYNNLKTKYYENFYQSNTNRI